MIGSVTYTSGSRTRRMAEELTSLLNWTEPDDDGCVQLHPLADYGAWLAAEGYRDGLYPKDE